MYLSFESFFIFLLWDLWQTSKTQEVHSGEGGGGGGEEEGEGGTPTKNDGVDRRTRLKFATWHRVFKSKMASVRVRVGVKMKSRHAHKTTLLHCSLSGVPFKLSDDHPRHLHGYLNCFNQHLLTKVLPPHKFETGSFKFTCGMNENIFKNLWLEDRLSFVFISMHDALTIELPGVNTISCVWSEYWDLN